MSDLDLYALCLAGALIGYVVVLFAVIAFFAWRDKR